MKKIILITAGIIILAVSFILAISLMKPEEQEEIVYGDIDFDAEVITPAKPASGEPQKNTIGTTYLNLMNKGLFCETDDYYYFVIKYDMEKYLVRRDKETDETVKIYQGDIRNLFACNGWLYGIVNDTTEHMICMDFDGNNQYISDRYINNIRTMQTDGNKIYFTVDQRNITGPTIHTAICQCNMDLSNMEAVKTTDNELSQIDIVGIKDGNIYFTESCGVPKQVNQFIPIYRPLSEYPIIFNNMNEWIFNDSVCSMIVNEKVAFNCLNVYDKCIYISASNEEKNFLISYDMESKECGFEEYENEIDQIYEYSKGIILFSSGRYERIEK